MKYKAQKFLAHSMFEYKILIKLSSNYSWVHQLAYVVGWVARWVLRSLGVIGLFFLGTIYISCIDDENDNFQFLWLPSKMWIECHISILRLRFHQTWGSPSWHPVISFCFSLNSQVEISSDLRLSVLASSHQLLFLPEGINLYSNPITFITVFTNSAFIRK